MTIYSLLKTFNRRGILCAALCLSIAAGVCHANDAKRQAKPSPADILQSYLQALGRDDMKSADAYWEGEPPERPKEATEPCAMQASIILRESAQWEIMEGSQLGNGSINMEVVLKMPILDKLLEKIIQESISSMVGSSDKMAFQDQLCGKIAQALPKTPKEEIASLPKKNTSKCFTMAERKNGWKIIRQENASCQAPHPPKK